MSTEIKNNPSETKDEIIRKKEQKLYNEEFIKTWDIGKFPNGHVSYIQNNVYWVFLDKEKLSYYITETWEPVFSIWTIRKFQFVDTWEAILGSGYFEKKEWEIYKLYRVLWLDKNDEPVLEKTPINPYSKEYYDAWQDILFNAVLLSKTLYKKNPTSLFSKEELEGHERNILENIETWAILIEDLETLRDQKKITEEFFKKAVKKIVEEKLLLQCSDIRLDKVKQWITEERLKRYFEKGYINTEIAKNCILAIKAKGNKVKGVDKIWDDTWKKLSEIK